MRVERIIALSLAWSCFSATYATAATKTWTGAVDASWSTPGNWSPSGMPGSGDDLVFPSGASNKTNSFDFSVNYTPGSITFSGGGYVISSTGHVLDLSATAISCAASVGTNTLNAPLTQIGTAESISIGSSSTLVLGGNINLGANTHTLTFSGGGSFTVSGVISGSGNLALSMTSLGVSTLSGANTYSGTTTITSGFVLVQNAAALGSTAGATTVNGGVLEVQGGITVGENLNIQGVGFLATGALVSTGGTNVWSGDIAVTGDTNVGVTAGSLEIQGTISGSGALGVETTSGGPILFLSGLNTYTGTTTILQGRLGVKSQGALGSTGVGTLVQNGGTLEIEGIAVSGEPLTLNGAGDAGAGALRSAGFGLCQFHGDVTLGSNSTITTDVQNLILTGFVTGPFGITKEGAATLTYSMASKGYTGATTVNSGTLNVAVGLSTSGVTVNMAGTLKGSGTFAAPLVVNALGVVAPGNSPGVLSPGNTTLASSGVYQVEIGGTTAGTNYDQLNVTGTVTIGGSILQVHLVNGYVPAGGETFTIINNDGADAVSGTFSGHPNNSFLAGDGSEFKITYNAGTGNDVVLTALPPITVTIAPAGPTELCGTQLLTANATGGTGSYSVNGYTWYLGGVAIMGANAQTYMASQPGSYTVTASDPLGVTSAPSAPADLTNETTAPTVTAPIGVIVTQSICS